MNANEARLAALLEDFLEWLWNEGYSLRHEEGGKPNYARLAERYIEEGIADAPSA